jgi:SAM-dependent methyltransferase
MLKRLKSALGQLRSGSGPAETRPAVFGLNEILDLAGRPTLEVDQPKAFYNPPADIQARFVGISFENAFHEAAEFLNFVFQNSQPSVVQNENGKILDFGCGWGRMLRLIKSKPEYDKFQVYGCDALEEILAFCMLTVPGVWLEQSNLFPPSVYRDSLFDLIYGYSVFSHLSPECHLAWAQEFARILKPGGRVCITTRPRRHIDLMKVWREVDQNLMTEHQKVAGAAFADPSLLSRYDNGEFIYVPLGGGDALEAFAYGEAVVPRKFFETHWPRYGFKLIMWDEGPQDSESGQARAIFQKE